MPSEVEGTLVERRFEVDDVVKVGEVVAIIETSGGDHSVNDVVEEKPEIEDKVEETAKQLEDDLAAVKKQVESTAPDFTGSERFYSPLVKNIAKEEGISLEELDSISGTGLEGRVTKSDILNYIEEKGGVSSSTTPKETNVKKTNTAKESPNMVSGKSEDTAKTKSLAVKSGDEVVPLSRMGKLIAQHMVESVATSAHVQSFVEVDVTNLVTWRNKVKVYFEQREGEKLTFTPLFLEAVAIALKKFPLMNISLDGDRVIKKKDINIGMAAALPDGNLIVPVIKKADQLNLVGMAKTVNDLADRSRNNALKPDEIKDGTYTVTNVGSFGSVFGTPIINQPQVGILALGAIRKTPSVIETPDGDFIGIRHKMFLSHSYDHRVVNGALGGMFVKSVADYLEAWDVNREI